MIEDTPASNANFNSILTDEIVRLYKELANSNREMNKWKMLFVQTFEYLQKPNAVPSEIYHEYIKAID